VVSVGHVEVLLADENDVVVSVLGTGGNDVVKANQLIVPLLI
jgi:hypothetical protein